MSWHFWIIPVVFFWFFGFRRMGLHSRKARARWEAKLRSKGWERDEPRQEPETQRELEDQRSYIESMELRIAELENRLDFTERLLAGRSDLPSSQHESNAY